MANILLLADDPAHSSATNLTAALQGNGHTVTVAAAANYDQQNYDQYDLILLARVDAGGTYTSGLVTTIRSRLDGGQPVGIGLTDFAVSSNATNVTTVATLIGLAGLGFMSNGGAVNEIDIINNSAGLPTEGLPLGEVQIYTANNFDLAVDSLSGTVLAVSSTDHALDDQGLPALSIVESGTSYNGGANTTGARCFLYSALYAGQSGYTAAGSTLLDNLVSWATASASGDATATPLGVSATGAIGTVQVNLSPTVAVTGVQAAGAIGTATVSTGVNATATPAGVSATGAVGDIAVVVDGGAAVTGVSATGSVGAVTATGTANVAPSGVSATGAVGNVTVIGAATVASVIGVEAAGQVGTVRITGIEGEVVATSELTGLHATNSNLAGRWDLDSALQGMWKTDSRLMGRVA